MSTAVFKDKSTEIKIHDATVELLVDLNAKKYDRYRYHTYYGIYIPYLLIFSL